MKNFVHIISFVCAKQQLEPMRWFVTYLQGNFGFKKIEEIIDIKKIRERCDEIFQSEYIKTVSLDN